MHLVIWIFGHVNHIWPCLPYLPILTIFGHVNHIWLCHPYLVMSTIFGHVSHICPCQYMTTIFGHVNRIWLCHPYLIISTIFGHATIFVQAHHIWTSIPYLVMKPAFGQFYHIFNLLKPIIITVDTHLLLFHAYSQIRFVKLVRYVPPKRTKVTAFLNSCVEETQTK